MLPTDEITVYYSVEPETSEIARVASEQRSEIEAILQKPFLPLADKDDSLVVAVKKLTVSSV